MSPVYPLSKPVLIALPLSKDTGIGSGRSGSKIEIEYGIVISHVSAIEQ